MRTALLAVAIVLCAGGCAHRTAATSGAPTPVPKAVSSAFYNESLTAVQLPRKVKHGAKFAGSVTVQNTGDSAWPATGHESVKLGYRFIDAAGKPEVSGGRTVLASDMKPHESRRLAIDMVAPAKPGRYQLELDMVYEFVAWFSTGGGAAVRRPVDVL